VLGWVDAIPPGCDEGHMGVERFAIYRRKDPEVRTVNPRQTGACDAVEENDAADLSLLRSS
jgi:hypothetical protein